jgi:hypothetical protein
VTTALGPDVDLNQEAKNLIAQWKETAAMEIWPPKASAPLQCLLREYHEISTSSSTLKTRNGLAKSEPRPAAQARSGLQHREAARTASSAKVEPLCRHHRVVLQVPFMQQN